MTSTGPFVRWCDPSDVRLYDCNNKIPDDFDLGLAIDQATMWLWRATGRKISGPYGRTLYPCGSCSCDPLGRGYLTGIADVVWRWGTPYTYWSAADLRSNSCVGACHYPEITLPAPVYPGVGSIQITIDGDVLAPTAYEVAGRTLRRLDGGTWPCSQSPTPWSIYIVSGRPVPVDARLACAELAYWLALTQCPGTAGDCELPKEIERLVSQGVDISMVASEDAAPNGVVRFGIWGVDHFVRLINPNGARRPVALFIPERIAAGRTRATAPVAQARRPALRNLSFVAGDPFTHTLEFRANGAALDVSARTYEAQIRANPFSSSPPVLNFGVDMSNAATGFVVIFLTDVQTATLTEGSRYFWDVQEDTETIVAGAVEVLVEVTV